MFLKGMHYERILSTKQKVIASKSARNKDAVFWDLDLEVGRKCCLREAGEKGVFEGVTL